jgi:stress-induced morphogen
MIDPVQVEALLKTGIPDAEVKLVDLTGTRDHYEATVVSAAFEGKSLIEQHKLVYGALGEAMHGPIHALALKTYTPEAWAKRSNAS